MNGKERKETCWTGNKRNKRERNANKREGTWRNVNIREWNVKGRGSNANLERQTPAYKSGSQNWYVNEREGTRTNANEREQTPINVNKRHKREQTANQKTSKTGPNAAFGGVCGVIGVPLRSFPFIHVSPRFFAYIPVLSSTFPIAKTQQTPTNAGKISLTNGNTIGNTITGTNAGGKGP